MKGNQANIKNLARLLERNLSMNPKKDTPRSDIHDAALDEALRASNNTWFFELHKPVTSHRKFIGRFIVFFKKLQRKVLKWYIRPLFEDQIRFNSSITRTINEVVGRLGPFFQNVDSLKEDCEELKQQVLKLKQDTEDLKIKDKQMSERLEAGAKKGTLIEDFDYLCFENKYRGERSVIKERQKIYLKFFVGQDNVLDIGCGRGEFVQLLSDNKIPVQGIDVDQDMVEQCWQLGLPVIRADAIDYLNNLPDSSLGGVFLGQVAEHLHPAVLVELVKLIYTKLKPAAHLIVETPNPLNLGIFSSPFYIDITHLRPVHPETLRFIFESAEFEVMDTLFLSPIPDNARLQLIDGDTTEAAILNRNIAKLNDLLFGFQDFSVIGRKTTSSEVER